ncbi:MAG TPA: c-type cytochrome [Vicinamibacterales bacterium]|nr:c-type cytochrome [Vicinamibacterales bacterium]
MEITKRSLCTGAIAVAVGVLPVRVGAQTAVDLDGGKRLFQGMCVECHGAGGAGGDAPSLNRPRLNHAADDTALANVIANGIPNTAMPRVRRFTENELRQLVVYVRSIGKVTQDPVPGDAKRGAAIYRNLACSSCHMVAGEGGNLGPDLTDIGFLRGAAYLREAVVDPGSSLPKGTLSVLSRGYAEYLPVHIITRQRVEVHGIRVNEDAFTIQVRDAAGKFYSLRKSDLELLDKQAGKSMMPSFASRLTGPELTDLVAYLVSLQKAEQ